MFDIKKYLDYEGVKYLWSKINMQDYPNNETLINVINAIDETKADKSELVQSDWTQTDETALDFIKNKPDIATDEDVMGMLSELGMVNPVTTSDGSILTSPTGEIYSL